MVAWNSGVAYVVIKSIRIIVALRFTNGGIRFKGSNLPQSCKLVRYRDPLGSKKLKNPPFNDHHEEVSHSTRYMRKCTAHAQSFDELANQYKSYDVQCQNSGATCSAG